MLTTTQQVTPLPMYQCCCIIKSYLFAPFVNSVLTENRPSKPPPYSTRGFPSSPSSPSASPSHTRCWCCFPYCSLRGIHTTYPDPRRSMRVDPRCESRCSKPLMMSSYKRHRLGEAPRLSCCGISPEPDSAVSMLYAMRAFTKRGPWRTWGCATTCLGRREARFFEVAPQQAARFQPLPCRIHSGSFTLDVS